MRKRKNYRKSWFFSSGGLLELLLPSAATSASHTVAGARFKSLDVRGGSSGGLLELLLLTD